MAATDREPAVIYGAGGLGLMVRDILAAGDRYQPLAFLDSDPTLHGKRVDGLPILGGLDTFATLRSQGVTNLVVAIGDNRVRIDLATAVEQHGGRLISAIHPLAMIAGSARLGKHLIVGARVTVCVHAEIGDHAVLSPGSIIEHDNQIGAGAFLAPAVRLAGGVTVAAAAWVGIGAAVVPGRQIGRAARVAPGSVVIRDVPIGATVSGVPAQVELPDDSRFVPVERPRQAAAVADRAAKR